MRLFFELVWVAEIFDSGCGSQLGTLGTHAKLLIWGAATILQSLGISLGLVPVEMQCQEVKSGSCWVGWVLSRAS